MNNTIAERLMTEHLVEGTLSPGNEIGLRDVVSHRHLRDNINLRHAGFSVQQNMLLYSLIEETLP